MDSYLLDLNGLFLCYICGFCACFKCKPELLHIDSLRGLICDFGRLSVSLCPDVYVLLLQLQSDLDQEYQDKFRRLPVEIQEFVQDSSKAKLSEDCLYGKLPASSTTERLNHKASQSEDEIEEGSTERVYDTAL